MEQKMIRTMGQRKMIIGFFLFLGLMWVCTLVSKSIYASGLPQVSAVTPEKMSIQYKLEAEGVIRQGSDAAMHTEEGLRVERILVREGDTVDSETALFQIEMEDLKDKIEEKKLEIAKLEYQISDLKKNSELADEEQNRSQERAKEDYTDAQRKADTDLNRADEAVNTAADRLKKHLDNPVNVTSGEDRQKAQAAWQDWTDKGGALLEQLKGMENEAAAAQQTASEAGAKAKQTAEAFAEAEKRSTEAASAVSAAQARVEEAEKNAADSTPSDGSPDPALQQALEEARAALAEAQAQQEQARSEAETAKAEADAAAAEQAAAESAFAAAKAKQDEVQKELEAHNGNSVPKPDYSSEDSAKSAWESSRESLEQNVKNARYAKEDAQTGREESLKNAGREVEDSMTPKEADSTLEIYRMELERMKKELEKYKEIEKADGKVTGDITGTVTGIFITAGERTPDGAAIVCADSTRPFCFEALLTKEQKKYINQGDAVTLDLGKGKKQELSVDYLAEEESSPGSWRAVIYLPENTGQLGRNGTLVKTESSESYDCCVPVDALYSENNGMRMYVYTVGEREGILGKELYAEKRAVKVLEQNEQYAALEPGGLSSDDRVITASDKEFTGNDVIRYRE